MKKLLASLLCVMMVFCMMPSMAFATSMDNCTENCTHQAAIGTTHYDTLAEAITAAASGDTVRVLKDIQISLNDMDSQFQSSNSKVYWTWIRIDGKTLTLDLNGHTISFADDVKDYPIAGKYNGNDYTEDFYRPFMLKNGATLTVTGNGTIDCHDKSTYIFILGPYATGSTLNIENGTYYAETIVENYSGNAQNYCNVHGGLFKANEFKDLSNNTMRYDPNYIFNLNGTAGEHGFKAYGGTFVDIDPHNMTDGDAVVFGYIVKKEDNKYTVLKAENLISGVYTTNPTGSLAGEYDVSEDTENSLWTVSATDPVAEVDGVGYATLKDAFSAVQTNGRQTTVTLLKDITLTEADTSYLSLYTNTYGIYKHYFAGHVVGGQNVVLNMNGKDISMTFSKETLNPQNKYGGSGLICVQDGGQLTITGSGSMTLTGDATAVIWAQSLNSKLTVDENCTCTFKAVKGEGSTAADAPIAAYTSHGGELYIKGGTYIQPYKDETLGNVSYAVLKDMSCPDLTEKGHNNGALTELVVTGGTFQGVDPNSNCPQLGQDGNWTNVDVVPAGYKSVNNGDGTWTVVKEQTSSSGGHSVTIQKPTIIADEGIEWTLNILGTKVSITVKDGYELADVKLNNEGLGKVGEVSGLKTSDTVVITSVKVTDDNEALIEKIKNTKLIARSKMSAAKGKKAVKVVWYAKDGSSLDYLEGFEVFRSSKRYEGYTQNAFFETARKAYWNTAIKSGNKYYYKVRGYVTIDGVKYYTDWSTKAWRTVK